MMRRRLVLLSLAVLTLTVSCRMRKANKLFNLVDPADSHIDFSNDISEQKKLNVLTYEYYHNGAGVAVGDINNDGLDDIFFSSNLHGNRLYLNKGNFNFEDVTKDAGVSGNSDFSTGVTMADVNGDGLLDIYVCSAGAALGEKGRNELFINNGNLTFTERAGEYGLNTACRSTQAVFFDFDNDGDLDMFLLNHSNISIRSYVDRDLTTSLKDSLAGDRLFRNDVVNGHSHFEDVTGQSGIYSSPLSFGLGVVCGDINGDGFSDLYVSNDFHENDYLYINNGDGTFTDKLHDYFSHTSKYGMGCDLADMNNDGLLDIMEVDMLPKKEAIAQRSIIDDPFIVRDIINKKGYFPQLIRNSLQLHTSNNKFLEIASFAGVAATDWSWAPLFADLDNDGFKDLYITNGILRRPNDLDYLNFTSDKAIMAVLGVSDSDMSAKLINSMPSEPIANVGYHNTGHLQFQDFTAQWGLEYASFSNGSAYADFDNDGALDLVTNNINQAAFLFRNNAKTLNPQNKYLRIKLKGNTRNTFGIGAKLSVYAGTSTFFQEQSPTRGFMSSVSPVLNIGLGRTNNIDSLTVIWPGGAFETIRRLNADTTIELLQKDASGNYYNKQVLQQPNGYLEPSADSMTFVHHENTYNDIYLETLIPKAVSEEGPALAVGDVNNDGLQDFFATGAKDEPGQLFLQQKNGGFHNQPGDFQLDGQYEGVGAAFFDADNDGDLDLYMVTGGNQYQDGDSNLVDLFYINDGKGKFTRSRSALPPMYTNGSCVKPADVDHDGLTDLFVGGRVVCGDYGVPARSYLLKNEGHNRFTEIALGEDFNHMGMVTDAAWVDIDKDGWLDLVVVGEWMPITIFRNDHGKLKRFAAENLKNTGGWWTCIDTIGTNKKGFMDFVVGNVGLNTIMNASEREPLQLYLKDFDLNGHLDPIITKYNEGLSYPLATKDQLAAQLPVIKKTFLTYASYSGTTMSKLLTDAQRSGAQVKAAQQLASVCLHNDGNGNFKMEPLPAPANFSTTSRILPFDVDGDGKKDLICGGNFYEYMPPLGRQDASFGNVLRNKGDNTFGSMDNKQSGIDVSGQIRDIKPIALANHRKGILIARNNERLLLYLIRADR